MNYPKINFFLLIAILIAVGVILFFLFTNKKDTAAQSDLLLQMAKKMGAEPNAKVDELENERVEEEPNSPTEEVQPTEQEWKDIYAISEKIYFRIPRTDYDKKIQKKFEALVNADLEFCNQFYPLVHKFMAGAELTDIDKEFYEANKDQVDDEVNHRKEKSAANSFTHPLSNSTTPELNKSNPPLAIEERNKKILSLFDDGVPKNMKEILPLYIKTLNTDPGKNLYRIFGKLEGKQLLYQKIDGTAYYGLPEWFDGKKLKKEYKSKIAA